MRYEVHLTTGAIVVMDIEADNEHAAAAAARAQVADWTPAQIAERAHLIPELDVDAVYPSDQTVDPAGVRAAMPTDMPTDAPTDASPAFMAGLDAWLSAAQSAGLDVAFSTHCWRDGPWIMHGVIGVRELPSDENEICGVVGVGQRYYVVVIEGTVVRALLVPVVCPCAVCGLERELGPAGEQGECFSEDAGRSEPGLGAPVCSDTCAERFYRAVQKDTDAATR